MERLISLFKEADYEQWSPSKPLPPPREHDEPLYFQQLLEYLRQQSAEERSESEAREESEALVGARAGSAVRQMVQ